MANEPSKTMEVCVTCGALLVVGDPHQRLDEHVSGKQHKGYAQIRSYLDQQRLSVSEQHLQVCHHHHHFILPIITAEQT